MRFRSILVTSLLIFLFCLSTLRLNYEVKSSNGYPVHNIDTGLDYATIQEAIDANETLDGHRIFVEWGTYYESVHIYKKISLVGENPETTTIDGRYSENTVTITANDVLIANFTIIKSGWGYCGVMVEGENATINNNVVAFNCVGILLLKSSNNTIIGNNVTKNGAYGIYIERSSNNLLRNNLIFDNSYNFAVYGSEISHYTQDVDPSNLVNGKRLYYWVRRMHQIVPLDAGYVVLVNCYNVTVRLLKLNRNSDGILLAFTKGSSVFDNVITQMRDHGIRLHASTDNNIYRNNITYCGNGISLYESLNNEIHMNSIINSTHAGGIFLYESSGNRIYHNNLINNKQQVDLRYGCSNNVFDDGYPSGGNYWSDYLETYPNASEIDDSGIWDTPYIIDGSNRDNYPLINPKTSIYPIPTLVFVSCPDSIEMGEWATITVEARNDGEKANEMYISVSLPDNPPIDNIQIISHDLQDAYILPVGAEVWGDYGTTYPIILEYPLVEGFKENWETGETKTLQFKVKPHKPGIFHFYVKTTAQIDGLWNYDPQSGIKDQQDEYVYVYQIQARSPAVDLLVPYEAQGNAPWCWAASTAMLMRYYGKNVHVWDAGKTRPCTWSLTQIKSYIEETYPDEFEIKIGRYYSVSEQIQDDIEGNLSKGYPVLLNVDTSIGRHTIVITGYNSSGFFINDPSGAFFVKGLGRGGSFPYIHEFASWEELKPLISIDPLDKDTFLVVEGTPSPIDATLFLINDEEAGIRTVHESDSGKGVCIDYGGWYWALGLYWRSIGWHPVVWDSHDNLNYHFEIFNHKSQEASFDFHLQIIGNDNIVYYEKNILDILVPRYDSWYAVELDILLKNYLMEGRQYVVSAELKHHGSSEIIDSITLPPIYYGVKSIMFVSECPVRILVTDPDGFRVGFDPTSNQTVNEISDALYYYGNGSYSEVISIPNRKDGNYSVLVFGVESGKYNLTCTTLDETGSISTESFINIPIEKDESQTYIIPEFQSFLIFPFFMTATLLATIACRRKHTKEDRG
ncbi:MAG: NosD domain-containing protein [Candidatus Bathyarchaeia archaeon]